MKLAAGFCIAIATAALAGAALHAQIVSVDPDTIGKEPGTNWPTFNGDYSGLTVNRGEDAHPIWSDTRNADPYSPANGVVRDEDVFTAKVALPNGKGKRGPGKIGK